MEIQTNSKIDFSSHRVTVAWRQSLMKRHENTRLCISDIIGPIESKLDMQDKTPGLMTSTHKSWLKMTAPPAGYRKWHVLYFDELLLAALQYTAQMSSVKSLDHGQYFDISSNRVNLEVRQRIILRQRRRCYHNSTVHCAVPAKLLSNDQSPSLNSSMCQYFSSVS